MLCIGNRTSVDMKTGMQIYVCELNQNRRHILCSSHTIHNVWSMCDHHTYRIENAIASSGYEKLTVIKMIYLRCIWAFSFQSLFHVNRHVLNKYHTVAALFSFFLPCTVLVQTFAWCYIPYSIWRCIKFVFIATIVYFNDIKIQWKQQQ